MAISTRKAPARTTRSKAEVQQEFSDIRKQVAAAEASADPKLAGLERQKEEELRLAVAGLSTEGVVQKLSTLGIEISRALAHVSEQLVDEVNRLALVREAVELEQKELGRLHKIDVAATALDQLVLEYAREKERQEAEIAAERTEWDQEKESGERERKEQEDLLKKQRQREIEDYEYKKTLERKKAQDKYDEEIRLVEKKNQEKQESLEKSWQQREANLKEQEQELARLKKEADQFPGRLQSEITQAAAKAKQETERQLAQEMVLLKKDHEADQRLAQMQIKTLEENVARQTVQLTEVQKQLNDAKQQVQDIAVKAIEGASGARALSHINQIAMEQAKQRSPQG